MGFGEVIPPHLVPLSIGGRQENWPYVMRVDELALSIAGYSTWENMLPASGYRDHSLCPFLTI